MVGAWVWLGGAGRDGVLPALAALLTSPGICGIDAFENGIRCAALGAVGRLVIGNFRLSIFDDLPRNGLRGDGTRLIELIGGDKDAWTGETESGVSKLTCRGACSRRLNPALDACLL